MDVIYRQFPFLFTAHCGFSSGNIIENTCQAMIDGFQSGADMAEINVIHSTDRPFYVFHDGNEQRLLHEDKNIKKLSSIFNQTDWHNQLRDYRRSLTTP